MKKLLICILCGGLSCGDRAERDPGQIKDTPDAAIFPVSAFLAGQLHIIDSLQLPLLKYATIRNNTDSMLISIAELKALANEFTEPDITQPSLRRLYKEESFADQSIPSVTLPIPL